MLNIIFAVIGMGTKMVDFSSQIIFWTNCFSKHVFEISQADTLLDDTIKHHIKLICNLLVIFFDRKKKGSLIDLDNNLKKESWNVEIAHAGWFIEF